jgi:NTE family protein
MAEMPESVNVVLEGGGVKGIAHVGAMVELKRRRRYRIEAVAGASSGAIVGALVAAGLSADELRNDLRDFDFTKLGRARGPFGWVRALRSLYRDGGLFPMDYLREWLLSVLASHGVSTFADLQGDGRAELRVVVSDLTRGQLVWLPRDYEKVYGLEGDRQFVADAVCASAAFPFFFVPRAILAGPDAKPALGLVDGGRSTLFDGGVLLNYPIDAFGHVGAAKGSTRTVGVKLLPRLPTPERDNSVLWTPPIRLRPLRQIEQMVGTMIAGGYQARLEDDSVMDNTVLVDTSVASLLKFRLSKEDRIGLYRNGQQAMSGFLDRWEA